MELILSNTTSFFSGNIESLFQNAKKYGFKSVEIIPYRWNTPEQILGLQAKYAVRVAGIHLPNTSWNDGLVAEFKRASSLWDKFWGLVFRAYLGNASLSPGLQIAAALNTPYLLLHSNIVAQMGKKIEELKQKFHVVIENIPGDKTIFPDGVFDHGHFNESRLLFPALDISQLYQQAKPEVIHISYNSRFVHLLPNPQEQEELKSLLRIHAPKYIVLETNPAVSIKKGKLLLEKILHPPF